MFGNEILVVQSSSGVDVSGQQGLKGDNDFEEELNQFDEDEEQDLSQQDTNDVKVVEPALVVTVVHNDMELDEQTEETTEDDEKVTAVQLQPQVRLNKNQQEIQNGITHSLPPQLSDFETPPTLNAAGNFNMGGVTAHLNSLPVATPEDVPTGMNDIHQTAATNNEAGVAAVSNSVSETAAIVNTSDTANTETGNEVVFNSTHRNRSTCKNFVQH